MASQQWQGEGMGKENGGGGPCLSPPSADNFCQTEGNHSWVKAGACVSYEDTGEEWIMCSQPDGGKKTEKLVRWHGLAKWSQTLLKGESGLGSIGKIWELV